MGIEYSIACSDCKVFLDCYKWEINEGAALALRAAHFPRHYEAVRVSSHVTDLEGSQAVQLTTAQLMEGIITSGLIEEMSRPRPDADMLYQLVARLRQFAEEHRAHSVFMLCDAGDLPWASYNEHSQWAEWKELDGPFRFYLYLPRVLVEDLGFRDWESAQAFLETPRVDLWESLTGVPGAVETAQRKFESLVKS